MRSIIDIGNVYTPSYMPIGRSPLLGSQRSRRHSSSITRERRTNSKNHKFDMAASNIANINSSINGLLNIVHRPGDHFIPQKVHIDRVLSSSREKYSPSIYERINYSSSLTTVSPYSTSCSNSKIKSPSTTTHQFVYEQKHASIKYNKAPIKRNGDNLNRQPQSLAESSKNNIAKLNVKRGFQTDRLNENVDNWWENILTEVDKGSKEIRLSKQKSKGQDIKTQ